MTDGGYDEGYQNCSCFWGSKPGSLVNGLISQDPDSIAGLSVLDAGCGEGKNAVALAKLGATVTAVDCSELGIANAMELWPDEGIDWICSDIALVPVQRDQFDIVIMYGLTHCLASLEDVKALVNKLKSATRSGGVHIYCAFNDRHQELEAHPGFAPLLVSHEQHLDLYAEWKVSNQSDEDLKETHPHNNISHTHSMTRFIARSTK